MHLNQVPQQSENGNEPLSASPGTPVVEALEEPWLWVLAVSPVITENEDKQNHVPSLTSN